MFFIFNIRELSVIRKDLQASTLGGQNQENPTLDPLAVQHLINQLYIRSVDFLPLLTINGLQANPELTNMNYCLLLFGSFWNSFVTVISFSPSIFWNVGLRDRNKKHKCIHTAKFLLSLSTSSAMANEWVMVWSGQSCDLNSKNVSMNEK